MVILVPVTLLLVLLAVLVVVVVIGVLVVLRTRRDDERGADLVPGRRGPGPGSWAGSSPAEALLHRRLRDALTALRANQASGPNRLRDLQATLEGEALTLDHQLVAIGRLPRPLQAEPLAKVADAVEAIERTVAATVQGSTAEASARLRASLDDIRERNQLLGQARAELSAPPPERPPTAR